ncbi:hypothetical protein ES703_90722 [subsurface metagenome]
MRKRGAAPLGRDSGHRSSADTNKEATRGKEISAPWVAVKTILATAQLPHDRNPQR